jgi:hypothetical protein
LRERVRSAERAGGLFSKQNGKNEIKRKQTQKKVDKPAVIEINGKCIVQGTFKISGTISSDESLYFLLSWRALAVDPPRASLKVL